MKLKDQKNSKMQGNAGIGSAIAYYTSHGYTVSVPLTDSQDYDLIVDSGTCLKKVQVKTTTFKRKDHYIAALCSCNLQGKTSFDKTKVDEVFILTEEGTKYVILASDIEVKNTLSLGYKYEKYKVAG